jgi:hypothetical protein
MTPLPSSSTGQRKESPNIGGGGARVSKGKTQTWRWADLRINILAFMECGVLGICAVGAFLVAHHSPT